MRILVATDLWFPDFRGGAARVAHDTAHALANRGHEITVLAPTRSDQRSVEMHDGVQVLRALPRSVLPQTASDVISARRLARRLGAGYDLLLAHQVTAASGFAAARTGLPLVLVSHGSPAREARLAASQMTRGRQVPRLAIARVLDALEAYAVRRAEGIVVLSNYMAALVAGDFPEARHRIRVAGGGVDPHWFSAEPDRDTARKQLGIGADETLVLAVRRLERGLGLETLLRAFQLVLRRHEARFVLIGGGSLEQRLASLGDELGLGSRLRLAGPKDGAELRCWYRAADIFVLAPAPNEGFGLATIEALASGVPAVAAPIGASPGILVPLEPRLLARSAEPGDLADGIAGAIHLVSPDLRRRCREYAASRFDWDRVIRDWEEILVDAARTHI